MSASRRGFTLVEMLVVMAIIAVLIGLLLPAVMYAVNVARRGVIATEIKSLADAVEAYKQKHGDYPPNLRDYNVFIRHVRKCYPKIDAAHLDRVINTIWPGASPPYSVATGIVPPLTAIPAMDEGECLVFWLYLIDNDARYPFKAADPNYVASAAAALTVATSADHLFPFNESRLGNDEGDIFWSYPAIYSGNSHYIYIDSRSYNYFLNAATPAYANGDTANFTRPYWSDIRSTTRTPPPALTYLDYKPVNPTSFQIICAGQDGEFGGDPPTFGAKFFPGGGSTGGGIGYTTADRDNMTNFSNAHRLQDEIP